jgi:ribonuclease BN (tRNA processing enzyme)
MRLTVLGGCGAWPDRGQACSGYLVEHDGYRLLLDVGYATVPRLDPERLDAVVISHGHPDHCADLNPLLRARVLRDDPAPPLPVYALPGALDAVLALDRPGMLDAGLDRREISSRFEIGPFRVDTWLLPHWVPNAGIRLTAGGHTLAYTGDTGPSPNIARLADDAEVFLAEASYVDEVPEDSRRHLSSARQAGRYATEAGVGRLVLTHLFPGTDAATAVDAAKESYAGPVEVATGSVDGSR